jgi:TonB family protein
MRQFLLLAVLVSPVCLKGQPTVQLLGDDESPVRPGETRLISLDARSVYTTVFVGGPAGIDAAQIPGRPGYQFSVHVSSELVAGVYRLGAMGCRRPGDCDWFAAIDVDVEPIWKPTEDGSHSANDAPGVTVDTGVVGLIHRSAIPYPREVWQKGIGGAAVVEVTPDSMGRVQGSLYLSGPEELRKDVIKAVLLWHFSRKAGLKTRQIHITFDPVEATRSFGRNPAGEIAALGGPYYQFVNGHTLKSINTSGLTEDARDELLNRIPIQPGQTVDTDALVRTINAVGGFDNDLRILWAPIGTEFVMTIVSPGFQVEPEQPPVSRRSVPVEVHARVGPITPQRIRVAAADQAAKLVSKVEPEYPPLAKAAHIQGIVRLAAVLSNDGRVMMAQVLSGPPLLVAAAQEAVKRWIYSPTVVNGSAVEVATEIDVEFFLPN